MNEWFSKINGRDKLEDMNANCLWIRFLSFMNEAIDFFAPKCKKGKRNVQW